MRALSRLPPSPLPRPLPPKVMQQLLEVRAQSVPRGATLALRKELLHHTLPVVAHAEVNKLADVDELCGPQRRKGANMSNHHSKPALTRPGIVQARPLS